MFSISITPARKEKTEFYTDAFGPHDMYVVRGYIVTPSNVAREYGGQVEVFMAVVDPDNVANATLNTITACQEAEYGILRAEADYAEARAAADAKAVETEALQAGMDD